jgi:hypothetical protein
MISALNRFNNGARRGIESDFAYELRNLIGLTFDIYQNAACVVKNQTPERAAASL